MINMEGHIGEFAVNFYPKTFFICRIYQVMHSLFIYYNVSISDGLSTIASVSYTQTVTIWKEKEEYVEQGVQYDYTVLNLRLDSISLKCYFQVWYMDEHWKLYYCRRKKC